MISLFKTIVSHITPLTWLITAEIGVLTWVFIRHFTTLEYRRRAVILPLPVIAGYIYLIFQSLVFLRPAKAVFTFKLQPFWSYIGILQGSRYHLWQDLLNVVLFVPVGFFLKLALPGCRKRTIIVAGAAISVCLELLQLILRRGLFETDDMINNTLGAVIGCFAAVLLLQVLTMDRKWKVIPAAIVMIMIYVFSAQSADASRLTSDMVILFLKLPLTPEASMIVRKCAHLMEYFVLGMTLCLVTDEWRHYSGEWPLLSNVRRRRGIWLPALWAFLLGAFWAVTDEIHQRYVPGRSGQVTDVLIDSAGCLAGVLAMAGLLELFRWIRGRRG